jgi:hypothetical protein
MAEAPTRGQTLSYKVETALGTAGGSEKFIRYEDEGLVFPSDIGVWLDNSNNGHQHPYNRSDDPIYDQVYGEGLITIPYRIRRASSADANPPFAEFLESAGWTCNLTPDTTVAGTPAVGSFDLTDNTGMGHGKAILVEDTNGLYYPVLTADLTTDTVTPAMDMPVNTAATNAVEVMSTCYPTSQQVPTTKTLTFYRNTRNTHTSGEDMQFFAQGCALSGAGDIVLEPHQPITTSLTFHCAKHDFVADAIAEETSSLADGEKFCFLDDNFNLEFADASSAGGITFADIIMQQATINLGINTMPMNATGSGTIGGVQGWMHDAATSPSVTLILNVAKARWDDMAGANTRKYIGLVQPTTSLTTPAFGFWLPNARQHGDPIKLDESRSYYTMQVTYIGDRAGYESDTAITADGAAPCYLAISGAGS